MKLGKLGVIAAAGALFALQGCNGGSNNGSDAGTGGTDGGTSGIDAGGGPTGTPGSDGGSSASDDANTLPLPNGGCADGQGMCPRTGFANEPTSSYQCRALIDGHCPAPDLVVVRELIVDDGDGHTMDLVVQNIAADDPVIAEGCVHAPGARRLLRFNYGGLNQGNDALRVGRPDEADTLHWQFSEAHHHFHVLGWADYRVRSMSGTEVGYGHKQSFCLEDNIRNSDQAGPREFAPPLCENFDATAPLAERPEFGLSPSWGDEYPAGLACQYVDLGPADPGAAEYVPDGFYTLAITINETADGQHLYRESNYNNNTASVRVQIRGTQVSACDDHAGEACAGGTVQCDGRCGG